MKYIYLLLFLATFAANAQDNETISWDAADINGKLKLTTTKREFDAIYKKADSIVSPNPKETCGTEEELAAKFLHYKGVKFEMDNGVLNFRKIDFTKKKGMVFNYKGTKFTENFTMQNFAKAFPVLASQLEFSKGGNQMVMIKPEDADGGFEWRFYFSKGKLTVIECYFRCD